MPQQTKLNPSCGRLLSECVPRMSCSGVLERRVKKQVTNLPPVPITPVARLEEQLAKQTQISLITKKPKLVRLGTAWLLLAAAVAASQAQAQAQLTAISGGRSRIRGAVLLD